MSATARSFPAAHAFPPVGQASSGRLATWLTSWLTRCDQLPTFARGSDWITPIVLAGLAGLGVGYQQWASRHDVQTISPSPVRANDLEPITSPRLRPDATTPSIDALLQRLRKQSHNHKEIE